MAICIKCQKAKFNRYLQVLKLYFISIETKFIQEIAIDFIWDLLESEEFNTILVIINQFIKMQIYQYILVKITQISKDIANAYLYEVWKLFGLLTYITSDRGLQFGSTFIKALEKKLDIYIYLLTIYHLQTDGLSEYTI